MSDAEKNQRKWVNCTHRHLNINRACNALVGVLYHILHKIESKIISHIFFHFFSDSDFFFEGLKRNFMICKII